LQSRFDKDFSKCLWWKQTGWILGWPPSYSAAGLDPTC